ncbi:MAG: hypothetical protein OXR68_00250 [Alphaproteobacteria bacterium]|nr:hypothetical protein [Alphaproteobacteria bacterium]MDD9919042.1 hypothetical protein [Alphaproteobacteria bacterium]
MTHFFKSVQADGQTIQINSAREFEVIVSAVAAALAGQSYMGVSGDDLTIQAAAISQQGLAKCASWAGIAGESGNQDEHVYSLGLHQAPSTLSAWAICDMSSGTPSILDSWNITSVSRNATGDYTGTLTNAMDSANYVVLGGAGDESAVPYFFTPYYEDAPTTTTARMSLRDNNMNTSDPNWFAFAMIGGRA